jgi:hypothetical protein
MQALVVILLLITFTSPALPQTRRAPARRPAPAAPPPMTQEPAVFQCLSFLGEGIETKRSFCDVLTGRDSAAGIVIPLPPHTGPVTLSPSTCTTGIPTRRNW